MSISLDHTIVHATDNLASARFLAEILGVDAPERPAHFTPVVSDNGVALDFMTVAEVLPHHYAFTLPSAEFDAAYAKVQARGITIYAWPDRSGEGEMNHRAGHRGFYFDDPDGNWMELIEQPADAGEHDVRQLLDEWAAAEVAGDTEVLHRVLADDFHGIGPVGFVLDKAMWLGRFAAGLRNDALSFDEAQVHLHGGSAIVVAVQDQQTHFGDMDTSGRFRVSIAVVREGTAWKVASCHIGPLDAHATRP